MKLGKRRRSASLPEPGSLKTAKGLVGTGRVDRGSALSALQPQGLSPSTGNPGDRHKATCASGPSVYAVPMSELIKRPNSKVERRAVEVALVRLTRYPGTITLGTVMRMVDEYAASQHTDRVYKHAEKVVAEALVEAHYAMERGQKIFLCEKIFIEGLEKNFYYDFSEKGEPVPRVGDACRTCPTGPVCLKSPESRECPHGPGCPICHETSVRDTSDTATDVPDTSGKDALVTSATDTRDSVPVVTDTSVTVTAATDNGDTATPATDTRDTERPTVTGATDTGDTDGSEKSKKCTQCLDVLPLSRYSRNRSRSDGHASACRECENERDRARREARRKAQNGA